MLVNEENNMLLDVICQHKSDGSLIPLKIRVKDEDGESQVFMIKAYKEIMHPGEYILPGGMPTASHLWQFECKISVFHVERKIRLFFNAYTNVWKMSFLGG